MSERNAHFLEQCSNLRISGRCWEVVESLELSNLVVFPTSVAKSIQLGKSQNIFGIHRLVQIFESQHVALAAARMPSSDLQCQLRGKMCNFNESLANAHFGTHLTLGL